MPKNLKCALMALLLCMLIQYDILMTTIVLSLRFTDDLGFIVLIVCQVIYSRNTRKIFQICGVKPADDGPRKDDFL